MVEFAQKRLEHSGVTCATSSDVGIVESPISIAAPSRRWNPNEGVPVHPFGDPHKLYPMRLRVRSALFLLLRWRSGSERTAQSSNQDVVTGPAAKACVQGSASSRNWFRIGAIRR